MGSLGKQGVWGMSCRGFTTADYIYCEDDKTFVDYWKYATLEDTGHFGHKVRNVTPEELKRCVADCSTEFEYCYTCMQYPESDGLDHAGHDVMRESCLTESFLVGPFVHGPISV